MPKVDLIVPVYNNYKITKDCIDSIILSKTNIDYRILLVDNNSTDAIRDFKNYPNLTYIANAENLGWCKGINLGIQKARKDSDYIGFLNNDIEVYDYWLDNLIRILQEDTKIGAVGPINSATADWQCYSRVRQSLIRNLPDFKALSLQEVNNLLNIREEKHVCITGMLAFFCTVFPKHIIDTIGGLDESFENGYGDDDDFARELDKIGYKLALALDTFVIHRSGTTFKAKYARGLDALKAKNSLLLRQKWPKYYGTV